MASKVDPASLRKARCSRIKRAQTEMLIEFMAKNRGFARGERSWHEGTRMKEEMWDELGGILNKLGVQISVEQWQTCWRDIKSKALLKAGYLRKARASIGTRTVIAAPRLLEQDKIVVGIFDTEHEEGLVVPDTLPEDIELQDRLTNGNNLVLEPKIISTVSLPNINIGPDCFVDDIPEAHSEDDEPQACLLTSLMPTVALTQPESPLQHTTPLQSPHLGKNTYDESVAKNAEHLRKERMEVTLEQERTDFQVLCENQTAAMQLLAEVTMKQAEVASKQAEAALKQAEASLKQAEVALVQAKNEERRIELQALNEERLVTVYGQVGSVMEQVLDILNKTPCN